MSVLLWIIAALNAANCVLGVIGLMLLRRPDRRQRVPADILAITHAALRWIAWFSGTVAAGTFIFLAWRQP